MNYYQFNIGDYTSHTTHLEPLEDLAFRRLLDFLYLHEKPLPKDLDEIAKLIRMRTHSDCIAYVLKEFFTLTDDGYINNRATSEILTFQEKSAKASESARARWDKNKNKNKQLPPKKSVDANALRTECEGNAIQETINKKQNTINKNKDKIPYQLVADEYNKFATRTNNPQITTITDKRKTIIKKAWQLDTDNANLKLRSNNTDYWKRLFNHASGSEFLNGNAQRGEGHANWKPSFEFLLREDTHLKIREGNY